MKNIQAFIKSYLNDIQILSEQHEDEQAFIKAVKEKWQDKDDLRRAFVMACREERERLEDESGDETGKDKRVNVLNGKINYA